MSDRDSFADGADNDDYGDDDAGSEIDIVEEEE